MKYVIIGNGIAGITAANELRRLDASATIVIISRESDHFFSRTALMYEFCGQLKRTDLEPFPRNHYDRMGFDRVRGNVEQLSTERQVVQLEDGQEISFDKLLIASGSTPARAPWQPEGVEGIGHFVTLQDLEWLKQAAARCKAGSARAAVVGGGLIGIEAAEILLLAGLSVDFVIREKWYWPVALNATESRFIAEHMREHGCNVLLETEVEEVSTSNGTVSGVRLTSGEVREVDLLLVSIGVRPATDFLETSGMALSEGRYKGIEVDSRLQSSAPNIYAAGDCATVTWFNGVRRPEQLWYTGRDQGLVAARNMYGLDEEYVRGPLYNSAKFFDVEYTTVGLVNFDLENVSEWYQQHPSLPVSQRIVLQNDKVIGFNMIGSRWDHRILIGWISEKRTLEYVLAHLREAQFDAEFAPKFQIRDDAQTYSL